MTIASTNGTTQTIKVRPLRLERLSIRIEGISPLIVDRFAPGSVDILAARQTGEGDRQVRAKKGPRNPEAEFEERLYRRPDGRFGFPSGGIKKAMVSAGMRVTDAQGTWLRAVLHIDGELLEIESPNPPRMRADHVV